MSDRTVPSGAPATHEPPALGVPPKVPPESLTLRAASFASSGASSSVGVRQARWRCPPWLGWRSAITVRTSRRPPINKP